MMDIQSIQEIYDIPLLNLVHKAYAEHIKEFPQQDIELCHLVSVKTGGCPEDCSYCSQSNKYSTEIKVNALLPIEEIERQAIIAKEQGVKRMCLGGAYKSPPSSAIDKISEYTKIIKSYGLETCATFGSLSLEQAQKLKNAGLDYYNHNIDTSPEYYNEVITTRTFQDRVDTINNVGQAGLKVCCGGILGLGESKEDRLSFIQALIKLPYTPDSIPINTLVKIKGTPLEHVEDLDLFELIRTIATIRILFPKTRIRLSAGRRKLSEIEQAMCFMAGANSIFFGEKLLTTPNPSMNDDNKLITKLGMRSNA
ncbi:MAG TPA: biotin synthase BioB [Burkholderiales bacterium]|nr:biotin synthase BioB [Burkholderiales bacterium]